MFKSNVDDCKFLWKHSYVLSHLDLARGFANRGRSELDPYS